MGRAAMRRMLVLCLLAALGLGAAGEERGTGPGRWQDLKVSGANVAVDSGGQLWTVATDGLRCWDGHQFVSPKVNELEGKASANSVKLYGDPRRGAYALISGSEPNQGIAYRLADGEVRHLTDFYREPSSSGQLGFCVSRTGVLINWGRLFLATQREGEWQRIEARLSDNPCIIDTPHYVVFASNGWIYTVDDQGRITELAAPELAISREDYGGAITASPRSGDAVQLFNRSTNAYYVFRADTGELAPLTPQPFMAAPAMAAQVASPAPPAGPHLFHTADGSSKFVGDLSSSLVPGWALPGYFDQRTCLAASDGSFWTVLPGGAMAHYKDGKLTVYDWRDGLALDQPRDVLEGAGGQVFVCSWRTIFVFLADQQPEPPAPWAALWEEHHLAAGGRAAQDSNGRIWVQKWDSPGEYSVWDGRQWTQCKVPFDLKGVGPFLTDDRGHLLFMGFANTDRAYDVWLDGAKTYDSGRAMLQALVADGVRHFKPVGNARPCLVLPDGRIWNGWDYYDGSQWTLIGWSGTDRIFESPSYGVLLLDAEGKHYSYYDRGQLVPLAVPSDRATFWLLGETGLQPFEQELVKAHPGAFLPTVRTADGKFYLLREMPSSTDADPPLSALGEEVPQFGPRARAGLPPVQYLYTQSGVSRCVVQGKAFAFSLADTPMAGQENSATQVMVDSAHNLWFLQGTTAFVKRTGDFRITAAPPPERVGKALPLDVRLEQPGLGAGKGYVFWRVNDGPWRGGVPAGKVAVPFADSGEYRVELIGVDPQGGVTPQPVKLTVRAAIGIPKTQATSEGPYTVKDVVWTAPVKAVPSSPDAQTWIEYRIDDGPWRTAQDGKVPTGGLKPGRHTAEFAANEKDGLRDKTPLRVELDYAPDYAFIVESRMAALTGQDQDAARRAMDEVRSAGPDALPVLQRKLDEARKAGRTAEDLRGAIEKLNEPTSPAPPGGEK